MTTKDVEKRVSTWIPITASAAGTIVEWYDFILYNASSALIFRKLFFPQFDPLVGTIAAFGASALGFFVRPIGGLIFGYLGDTVGRKPILLTTLILMGASTFCMGLLPTYADIGVWAPVLLIALRLLQGLGAGAEYGGAILVTAESVSRHRGFFSAITASAVDLAYLPAVGALALFQLLPGEQFYAWGWRGPFLLSAVVLGIGLFIRSRMPETAEFRSQVASSGRRVSPVKTLFRHYKGKLLVAMGVNFANNMSYIFQIFSLSYVTVQLKLPPSTILIGTLCSAVIATIVTPLYGALADRIGPRRVIMGGALFTCLYAFPFFLLLKTGIPAVIWAAVAIGHAGERAVFATQPMVYTRLFPVQVRYSGIGISREITGALVAGPLPMVAASLLALSGGTPWLVAAMVVGVSGVTLLTSFFIRSEPPPELPDTAEAAAHSELEVLPAEKAISVDVGAR